LKPFLSSAKNHTHSSTGELCLTNFQRSRSGDDKTIYSFAFEGEKAKNEKTAIGTLRTNAAKQQLSFPTRRGVIK
jgi:hypothetical protein